MKLEDEIKDYLTRHHRAHRSKQMLEKRLSKMQAHEPAGISYSDMPKSGNVQDPCYEYIRQKEELMEKIRIQMREEVRTMQEVTQVIDLLPKGTDERTILELRHIDKFSWEEIEGIMHWSRRSCYNHWNKGIRMLAKEERIKELIGRTE